MVKIKPVPPPERAPHTVESMTLDIMKFGVMITDGAGRRIDPLDFYVAHKPDEPGPDHR